jgi:hypothetical protein
MRTCQIITAIALAASLGTTAVQTARVNGLESRLQNAEQTIQSEKDMNTGNYVLRTHVESIPARQIDSDKVWLTYDPVYFGAILHMQHESGKQEQVEFYKIDAFDGITGRYLWTPENAEIFSFQRDDGLWQSGGLPDGLGERAQQYWNIMTGVEECN